MRGLVGNASRTTGDGDELAVEKGDTILLHHTTGPERRTGYLFGPFKANTDAGENIVEGAWSHKGSFPWQVGIDWEDTVYSLDVSEMYDEGEDDPVTEVTSEAQGFSEVQGLFLLGQLRQKGDPVISPP